MDIFDKLIDDFNHSSAWLEFFVIATCLLLAYAVVRGWGQYLNARGEHSPVWFGRKPLNGAIFPLLSLLQDYIAHAVAIRYVSVSWLHLAMPLLFSLAIIRFVARVLSQAFPQSTSMRWRERVFLWSVAA